MQTFFRKYLSALALAVSLSVSALMASGCGNKEQASATPTGMPVTATQKITAIEGNPSMPPQAKEAARAAIQAQQRRGSAGATAPK